MNCCHFLYDLRTHCSHTLFPSKCCIAENDGVGLSRDRESAVTMKRCTVVRNGLAPVKKEDEAVVPELIMIDSSETHV
jgi:hypothetical protein